MQYTQYVPSCLHEWIIGSIVSNLKYDMIPKIEGAQTKLYMHF